MKRLTLILLAVFAITACRNNQGTTDSGECNPTPSKVECKAEGTQFTVKTACPSYYVGTTVWEEITEENPDGKSTPISYTVKQVDSQTFDVTIKPFTGSKQLYLIFGVGEDAHAGVVNVRCSQ
jgi:hypothetical protein